MNKPLLKRVRDGILKYPTQFYMGWWYSDHSEHGQDPERCGTSACIAGWAVALGSRMTLRGASRKCGSGWASEDAQRFLQLDSEQRNRLFYADAWPKKFRVAFNNAKTDLQSAKVAARRINHFIKTNGRE